MFQKTRSHLPKSYGKYVIPLRTYEPNELACDETPHLAIHIIKLYGKYVNPLSTYEPNELAHDETPHLAIHMIKYMAIIEFQKGKTDWTITLFRSALMRPQTRRTFSSMIFITRVWHVEYIDRDENALI